MDKMANISTGFLSAIESKFVIATIAMIVIASLIIYIIFILVSSFRSRKESMAVSLPDINRAADNKDKIAKFPEDREFVVELVHSSQEDAIIAKDQPKSNDELFLTALTLETGQVIVDDVKLDMPEVGDVDFNKIKEEIKLEKDKEAIDHLRELAKADNDDEQFDNIEELLTKKDDN